MSYTDAIKWQTGQNLGFGLSVPSGSGYNPLQYGLAPGAANSQYSMATDLSQFGVGMTDPMSVTSTAPSLTRSSGGGIKTPGVDIENPAGDSPGWFQKIGGGEGLGAILKGIGQLGSVWAAIQTNKIAKDSLKFQKDAYKTNLVNQTKSYNTALEGRAQLRFSQEGNLGAKDDYLNKNRL